MRLALLATIVVAAGAFAPAAMSHSIVLPFSSRPADLQLYTVVVPTEADSPTTEVALKVPDGIDFLLVKDAPGWDVKIERRNDRIDVIRWTGSAPPDTFAQFGLIARNPILEGPMPWKITQTYGDGDVVRWIGPAGSEFPASITHISETADPVDVATGLNGGGDAAPSGDGSDETEAAAESTTAEDSSDTVARTGAAAALLIGLGALGATLLTRRRASRTSEKERQ